MKKFLLIGFLILTTSCNMRQAAPAVEPSPSLAPTIPAATLIPTETLTPEPTLTPTPAFTPTPVPLHFTEEFNTDLGAWTTFQTGGAQPPVAALANDALNIQMASPHTWFYAIHNAHEYDGVFISAKVSGARHRISERSHIAAKAPTARKSTAKFTD